MSSIEAGTMFGAGDASTFMGLPACRPDEVPAGAAAVIAADTATPYASVGAYCAGAAAAIRRALAPLAPNLAHMDFDLGGPLLPPGSAAVDCGDIVVGDDHAANRAAIRDACGAILDRGGVPVLLGGDDSVPLPLIEALAARGPLAILQIDAHIDWRDEVQGERLGLSSVMRRAAELDGVGPIVQIGQRSVGSARPTDADDARAAGCILISGREAQQGGIAAAIAAIPEGSRILIALDVDALDPSVLPAVILPAPGGLAYMQVLELVHGAASRGRIVGMNCVEMMTAKDVDGLSALTAGRIVANVIGAIARQPA